MHPRLSVNTLCLGAGLLETHVARVAALGAAAISPTVEEVSRCGVSKAVRELRDAGLAVATLTHRAFGFATPDELADARRRLDATIDVAGAISACTVTFTTGGRGALDWRTAADRFASGIAPCAARAREAGVALSLEPTSHLYADVSIAHGLTETVALANTADIGIGIDLFACWTDADIDDAIRAAGGRIALVQVSDQIAGDRSLPCRAVPGDGMVPIDDLVRAIEATGYGGAYDIEVIGPRLADKGADRGLARAGARLSTLLAGIERDRRTASARR